jgi:hypothetical protein
MAKAKPETEIKLSELQEIYLKTRDPAAWREMFEIMIKYARSLTLKVNKGKVYLDPEHVLAVATDSAIKIMSRYDQIVDPNKPVDPNAPPVVPSTFRIEHSFGGLLRWKVLESLYGNWEEEAHLSLNAIIGDDSGNKTELGDLQDKMGLKALGPQFTVEMDETKLEDLRKSIRSILVEFDIAVDSYRLSLAARLYLLLTLRKSKIRQSANLFKQFIQLAPKEEQALDLLLLEIRNRLCSIS